MAKYAAAALAAQVAVSSELSPPSPLAIGVISGFVSDQPVLMTCGETLGAEALTFHTGLKELRSALTHMPPNFTQVEDAIKDIEKASKDVPAVRAACEPLGQSLVQLRSSLKQLHGPRDWAVHILDHLVQDGDKIFGELSQADKSYKTGWDYMTAGQNLGMAFRRMLVGEYNNTIAPEPPIPECRQKILEGMAVGFVWLPENKEYIKCIQDAQQERQDVRKAMSDMKRALSHFNITEAVNTFPEIQKAMEEAVTTKTECKADTKTLKDGIERIVQQLIPLKGLPSRIEKNIFSDGDVIFKKLQLAADAHKNKDCLEAGLNLGMAFRHVLVGEIKADSVVVVVV